MRATHPPCVDDAVLRISGGQRLGIVVSLHELAVERMQHGKLRGIFNTLGTTFLPNIRARLMMVRTISSPLEPATEGSMRSTKERSTFRVSTGNWCR